MSDLQEAAEALLADVDRQEGESKHARLTAEERGLILQLHARDVQGVEIARIVGCNPSTVSRVVKFADMRPGARMLLNSKAAEMAQKIVEKGDPETHRKTLTQLGVLPKDTDGDVQFTVVVGMQRPIEPPTIPMVVIDAERS